MQRFTIAAAFAIFGLSTMPAHGQEPGGAAVGARMTYDQFMRLDLRARGERFGGLSPENKALIKRTHAERWLGANRGRLSQAQVAVAEEAIAFVTPELYLQPTHPEIVTRAAALKQQLTCILGHDNATQAFVLDRPPSRGAIPTLGSTIDAWLSWFSDCLALTFRSSTRVASQAAVAAERRDVDMGPAMRRTTRCRCSY